MIILDTYNNLSLLLMKSLRKYHLALPELAVKHSRESRALLQHADRHHELAAVAAYQLHMVLHDWR